MITDATAEVFAETACNHKLHTATVGEIACLFAVALLESTFGYGWNGAGVGSYNMGAVQCGGWQGGKFYYVDTHPNPDGTSSTYRACFRKYPTEQAGWDDLSGIMYTGWRECVRQAAIAEDWLGVSQALYNTKYYEGFGKTPADRVMNHDRAMRRGINRCLAVLQAPATPVPLPAVVTIPATLRYGDRGDAVRMLQRELQLVADSIFGRQTAAAVMAYQAKHGLAADGVVGPKTWAQLFTDDYVPIAA